MNNKILMPALSPTMTEGKLAKWIKKNGDFVKSGDVLLEIETDKATMEVESVDDGYLTILVEEGANGVRVNTEIGILSDSAEAKSQIMQQDQSDKQETNTKPELQLELPVQSTKEQNDSSFKKSFSPLAKRMMEQNQIDKNEISGSGPMGRIIKDDIIELLNKRAKEIENKAKLNKSSCEIKIPEIKKEPEKIEDVKDTKKEVHINQHPNINLVEASNLRKTIAERLTFAKQSIPHFYLSVDCNIDKLLKLRTEINEQFRESKVSINDFIIKASGIALRNNSGVNSSWENGYIRTHDSVDVSVAVAIDGGLITPIIRDADKKNLREISSEVRVLAKKAKEGKLALNEFQGGNFTISNLGMYGIKEFSAIINPPQSCILAVGMGQKIPVVIDSEISIANIVNVTMSCDHRVVDGVLGANFLSEFKGLIENPLRIII